MTNELIEAYCEGAKIAYKDCSDMVKRLISNSPPEIRHLIEPLMPIADAMLEKSNNVHKEANNYLYGVKQ